MCQIVSGKRRDGEDLTTSLPSRRLVRNSHSFPNGNPMDILLSPATRKVPPFPPGGLELKIPSNIHSIPSTHQSLAASEENHSCFICSRFIENAATGFSTPSPANAQVTLLSIFKYAN